jgi:integrase
MTRLRAVLNLAYRDGHVATNFAWRVKLLPIKGADRRRDIYLDASQRRALLDKLDGDIADFVHGLCLVPLRPGALAALAAGAFDRRLNMLTIGHDKSGKDRKIGLPEASANFFSERCKDKSPTAPLLGRANGKSWNKDAWKNPIKQAVSRANLPGAVSCYTIRHSVITDLIHGGVDALTVAQLSGTSVLMIERHYGHLTQDHARNALARLSI